VTDLHDGYDSFGGVHNVENPELSLAESITILPGELLAPGGAWIVLQSVDLVDDAAAVRLPAYGLELLRRGRLDEELITFHFASDP